MRMGQLGAATALWVMFAMSPGIAQEEIIKGVYVGSKELCDQAKKDGLQTVIEAGNILLSNRGLDAIEYNCAFLQVLKNPRMPAAWVATSMCEEPGYAYPELFSIVERTPGELELAAMSEVRDVSSGEEDAPTDEAAPEDTPQAQPAPQASPQPAPPAPPATAQTQPPAEEPPAEDAPEDGDETFGLSGTYYRCDGVALP